MPSSTRYSWTPEARWWCAGRSGKTYVLTMSARVCGQAGRVISCMSSTGAREPLSSARAGQMDRPAWRVPVLRGEQGPVLVGLLPLLFLAFLFLLPVIRLLLLSVEGGTLAHFEKAVSGELYVQVLLETFKIATIVTAVSLLLAYPVAYCLATASPRWEIGRAHV